jgi:hypothetical protein
MKRTHSMSPSPITSTLARTTRHNSRPTSEIGSLLEHTLQQRKRKQQENNNMTDFDVTASETGRKKEGNA